jgi:amidase
VLRLSIVAAGQASSAGTLIRTPGVAAQAVTPAPMPPSTIRLDDLAETSIADLSAALDAHRLSSVELVQEYRARIEAIDRTGPFLNSILQVNRDALTIAADLDVERRQKGPRSPLHGVPILVKDNVDTADSMQTTAGSLALVNVPVPPDSTSAANLRKAGAVLLGKTNLSEWANFRSTHSSSGWSGRGGQCNMPYVLDRNPCGSSSGSGAAAAASLSAATIATQTDGSIVCPASACGVVGIKPTVGLTSRAGVIPISHVQDTIGPHGRTVADAATVLGALIGVDSRDSATAASAGKFVADYRSFLKADALRGAKICVGRNLGFGVSEKVDAIVENALNALRGAGAPLVDVKLESNDDKEVNNAEFDVLLFDFKADIAKYLSSQPGGPQTLADLIAYNKLDAARELRWFGQEIFEMAEGKDLNDSAADKKAIDTSQGKSRADLDAVLASNGGLDAIVAPTGSPAWTTDLVNGDHFVLASSGPCARAGYPIVTVPAGFADGLPVGISLLGGAWSEGKLISLAYAYEQATHARVPPTYIPTLNR